MNVFASSLKCVVLRITSTLCFSFIINRNFTKSVIANKEFFGISNFNELVSTKVHKVWNTEFEKIIIR